MLSQDQHQALRAPFPPQAYSPDTSRGFELTSIKAAYVIERLNDVFGPCGVGWRYAHGPFGEVQSAGGSPEVITEVAFQYRYHATNDCTGSDPVVWNTQLNDWASRTHASNHDWSEPIFACGGHAVGRGSVPYTDARKSAVTDGLTKAASLIGVGHEVFKGLVRVGDGQSSGTAGNGGNGRKHEPGNGHADATAFWTLYRAEGSQAGVTPEAARALADGGDWAAACAKLRTLIAAPAR